MLSDQSRIIEQAKFTYSPVDKEFDKLVKTIEDERIKQVEVIKALKLEENQKLESSEKVFIKNMRNIDMKNKADEIKKWEEKIKQNKIYIYKTNKYTYDFQQYENIRLFGNSIYTGKTNIDEADMDQIHLLENIVKFNNNNKIKRRYEIKKYL